MRVVLVVPAFPRRSETFIAAKALGLLDRGVDVHIVCDASRPAQWAEYGADHAVHRLRDRTHLTAPTRFEPGRLGDSARLVSRVARRPAAVAHYLGRTDTGVARKARDLYLDAVLVDLAPDVVHFEFGSLAVGRTRLKDRLGAALTVSFRGHDLNFVGLDDPDHLADVWRDADAVHVLGQDLWRRALARGAPADLPHTIIPPALDAEAITPPTRRGGTLGTPDAPLRLLSVGRLGWAKGYDFALDAVACLRRDGIQLEHRIVGEGDLLAAVAFWRHQRGLDDVVELVGGIPPGEVPVHLAWADVLLHAATSEGFCNAVLEAQAHALPVVTSDADGLGENVAHGVSGLVVPRRDAAALADAVAHYAAAGPERLAAGRAGRERALHQFRLPDQLDAWMDFYEQVCP
jgi:colanic acid/amylovoran biosynthesis glycosyltransferase